MPDIDNTNRNFKGQQKGEVVQCFCRKHWIVLIPHIVICILIFGGLPLLSFFLPPKFSPLSFGLMSLALLGFTYSLHAFFIKVFNYYLRILIITNFRIIQLDQTLYFQRSRDSLDLSEIQDIEVQRKGVFQTIFNYGELIITLSSVSTSKTLRFVPNPDYHFRKINKTKMH